MAYTYDITTSKKDNSANTCLFISHSILAIVDLFVSTFMVAHIYDLVSSTTQYIAVVGEYFMVMYLTMMIVYLASSYIIDRTNRVWAYRLSIIIETALVVLVAFKGSELGKLVWLAGMLYGITHGLYYSSYNLIRQEMVSRTSISGYVTWINVVSAIIKIIVPTLMGAIISVSTYSQIAIYMSRVCAIQFFVTFGIKSKRPENSSFSLRGYFKKTRENKEFAQRINMIYMWSIIYGFTTTYGIIINICTMLIFGTSMSLGILTSVFSAVSVIALIIFNKFAKPGKRSGVMWVLSTFTVVGTVVFVAFPSVITLVIYSILVAVARIIYQTVCDIHKNENFKEFGMYDEIAEHHAIIECLFCFVRAFAFGLIFVVGTFGNEFSFYILSIVYSLAAAAIFLINIVYEKKYCSKDLKENKTSDTIETQTILGEINENN